MAAWKFSCFLHFNIRPLWFPAHRGDRLVHFFTLTLHFSYIYNIQYIPLQYDENRSGSYTMGNCDPEQIRMILPRIFKIRQIWKSRSISYFSDPLDLMNKMLILKQNADLNVDPKDWHNLVFFQSSLRFQEHLLHRPRRTQGHAELLCHSV